MSHEKLNGKLYDFESGETCPKYLLVDDNVRVETGAYQFGEDWPGIFIRGDQSIYFSLALADLINMIESEEPIDLFTLDKVKSLIDILQDCKI